MKNTYRRDCLLGALSGALMLVGDLCLSVIPASAGDSGLFLREAYLNGNYPAWRLPLLLGTGVLGMALSYFTVRAARAQIRPECRRLRWLITVSGAVYVSSAGVIHLLIGSLADWTSTLGPLLGREETAALVLGQYQRLTAALILPYFGMIALILTSFWAVASGRSILPRRMALVHMLVWQIVFAGIPDLRQALGAEISTWDFVLSQGSGNAALLLWMLASALCAKQTVKGGMEHA